MQIKEIATLAEMEIYFPVMQAMYPEMNVEQYKNHLTKMIPNNYKQLIVLVENQCVAITGFWVGTKLWSGKYIEIDNFLVNENHRKKGYGKVMTDYLAQKAIEINAKMIVLDAFTGNFKAHRFYYNQGYSPKGFHFIKFISEK